MGLEIVVSLNTAKTGTKIRKLMDDRGLNVTAVQNACGLECPQSVYKWINGKSVPSIDNLGILRKLFHVTLDEMLVFDDYTDNGKEVSDLIELYMKYRDKYKEK